MASVSQFAAPRDGEASFWFAYDTTPLGLPGTPEAASVSQFAAPRDGDASFWSVYNATPPGLPGAPERGDCFAVRSPKARQGLLLVCA